MATDKSAIILTPPELNGVSANIISEPIFAHGNKSVEFTIVTNAAANFRVRAISSLQETPPDPSIAFSGTNDYSYPDYIDETGGGATYNNSNPATSLYNPTATAVNKSFRFNTNGARWVFIQLVNYVAGTLLVCNVSLSDNQ